MDIQEQRLLDAVKKSLKNESVQWKEQLTESEWESLFYLADLHSVLPMVFEAVYACIASSALPSSFFAPYKQKALYKVTQQVRKTSQFLLLYHKLREKGITPLVVKGIICCGLYPNPDHRTSIDEDILIPSEQFPVCHEILMEDGMYLLEPERDIYEAFEVSYKKKNSPVYIEVHKRLFAPGADAYGDFNYFFEDVFERAQKVTVYGEDVWTMGYTDHLFYLICHAFKHFLHSGFGIRQICDISMFANTYGRFLDWEQLLVQCREIHADKFTAAIFCIGEKYLTFSPEEACFPANWQKIQVDETALLEDVLSAGIYGATDKSRLHSSNIMLNVAAGGKNSTVRRAVLKSVFPSLKVMKTNYPYLKRHPYLLPAAWIHRIFKYGIELKTMRGSNVIDSVKIGQKRAELLRKYDIIN